MKTKEELNTFEELSALKEEAKAVSKKLHELTEEEVALVSGGDTGKDGCTGGYPWDSTCRGCCYYKRNLYCSLSGKYMKK